MSFGIWELVVILLIVALLFGTKKLRSIGSDLGSAVKGFRSAVSEADKEVEKNHIQDKSVKDADVIEGEIETNKEASNRT